MSNAWVICLLIYLFIIIFTIIASHLETNPVSVWEKHQKACRVAYEHSVYHNRSILFVVCLFVCLFKDFLSVFSYPSKHFFFKNRMFCTKILSKNQPIARLVTLIICFKSIQYVFITLCTRAVASLMVPGGQDFHFPHFSSNLSIWLIFPQIFLIFFLILALRMGDSPTREGPGYATVVHKL